MKAEAAKGAGQTAIGCVLVLLLVLLVGWCASSDTGDDVPTEPSASAAVDAASTYRAVLAAGAGCDAAGKRFSSAVGSGDMVTLYRLAEDAESACLSTPSEVEAVEIPASVGKGSYDRFVKTREACSNAYLARWSGARAFKEAIDGGMKPSQLAEVQRSGEAISAGTVMCAAGLTAAAMEAGATAEQMGISDDTTAG